MLGDDLAEIHPVKLVPGQDQHVVVRVGAEMDEIAADGIGRALVPVGVLFGLLRRHDIDKSLAEGIEVVGALHMAVQGGRVELRQQEDAVDPRIQAIADRDIDQPVFAGQGHRRLAPFLGEGIEARASAAAHDDCEHTGVDIHGSRENESSAAHQLTHDPRNRPPVDTGFPRSIHQQRAENRVSSCKALN